MGEIKSALELALERTADVKSDRSRVDAYEARQAGMKLAGRFLSDPQVDVKRALKDAGDQRKATSEGFFQVMLSHLALPTQETDLQRLAQVQAGLEQVIPNTNTVTVIMEQVAQLLQQFLDTRNQFTEKLRQQFEPRLREKEQQIAQQTGRRVKLDPASDPEFAKVLNQNLQRLQQQYSQVVEQAREQLSGLFDQRA